jgi:hypothetical protein
MNNPSHYALSIVYNEKYVAESVSTEILGLKIPDCLI